MLNMLYQGRLPALGWNTWNMYACDISEDHLLSAAKMMKQLGLQDAGYEYVVSQSTNISPMVLLLTKALELMIAGPSRIIVTMIRSNWFLIRSNSQGALSILPMKSMRWASKLGSIVLLGMRPVLSTQRV